MNAGAKFFFRGEEGVLERRRRSVARRLFAQSVVRGAW
jgi:hypothetical protein